MFLSQEPNPPNQAKPKCKLALNNPPDLVAYSKFGLVIF